MIDQNNFLYANTPVTHKHPGGIIILHIIYIIALNYQLFNVVATHQRNNP